MTDNLPAQSTNYKIIGIVVVAILGIFIAYYQGVSAGKASIQAQHKYTDHDYLEADACYNSAQDQITKVNDITKYMGNDDQYTALETAVNGVNDIVNATTVAIPNPNGGYYDCPPGS